MGQFYLSAALLVVSGIFPGTALNAAETNTAPNTIDSGACIIQEDTLRSTDNGDYMLSIEEALAILLGNNNTIKNAEAAVEIAQAQKQQLRASWYPSITATGGYFHFSNNISADANAGELAQGMLEDLSASIPGLQQLIPQVLPQMQQIIAGLSSTTLSVPLLKSDIATLDAVAVWPLITGGKRIYASRIGNSLHTSATHLLSLAENAQTALMLNAYYTLKLTREVENMEFENIQFLKRLVLNASRLKEEGFINKAEFLVVRVAMDEAERGYSTAVQNRMVAASALGAVLGKTLSRVHPQGEFFTLDSIPAISAITGRILQHNSTLEMLRSQSNILADKRKIAESNYIPNFALFAKQNIISGNIPKNLMPRTIVGVAMQWDIFDGFARENGIKESRLQEQQLEHTISQAEKELTTAAVSLRGKMEDAQYNISVLQQTIDLAEELLREREKSFAEGMCTSTDVVEARLSLTKARTALKLAQWEYCTSLASLLALSSDSEDFIKLHNKYTQNHE